MVGIFVLAAFAVFADSALKALEVLEIILVSLMIVCYFGLAIYTVVVYVAAKIMKSACASVQKDE